MNLVDLPEAIPDAIIDLRYASSNNVTGKPLYAPNSVPRLDEQATQALVKAAKVFRERSLKLVIWDAYRTPEVQAKLQAVNPDERYVLNESEHCKGLAIDITLATVDGTYLEMGTGFDDFSERAHPDADGLTEAEAANRWLLREIMESVGFTVWPYEWWHFNFTSNIA